MITKTGYMCSCHCYTTIHTSNIIAHIPDMTPSQTWISVKSSSKHRRCMHIPSVIYVTFTGRCSICALEKVLRAIRFLAFLPHSMEDEGKRVVSSRIGGSFSVSSLIVTASAWNADLIITVGRNCSGLSSHYTFHFLLAGDGGRDTVRVCMLYLFWGWYPIVSVYRNRTVSIKQNLHGLNINFVHMLVLVFIQIKIQSIQALFLFILINWLLLHNTPTSVCVLGGFF